MLALWRYLSREVLSLLVACKAGPGQHPQRAEFPKRLVKPAPGGRQVLRDLNTQELGVFDGAVAPSSDGLRSCFLHTNVPAVLYYILRLWQPSKGTSTTR
jgi:hypothetical protein